MHVRLDHDGHQRLLGTPPRLEQPRREIAAVPQLGNLERDGADARVPRPRAIAVALIDTLGAALAVAGAAHRVRLSIHQRHDDFRERLANRIWCLLELLAQPTNRVDLVCGGHRPSSGNPFADGFRRMTLWPPSSLNRGSARYTTYLDTT